MKTLYALALASLLAACGGGGDAGIPDTAPDLHVMESVVVVPNQVHQTTLSGQSIYVMPFRDLDVAAHQAAAGNPVWVYLYDEMFWTEELTLHVGLDEPAITESARLAHAVGVKVMVSILPRVILDSSFTLSSPNSFDVIGIDIYPSNEEESAADLLVASMARLRSLGFAGEIWYIYQGPQGFPSMTAAQAADQAKTVARARAMGVTGLVEYNY